jgi:hypothetical protein
MKPLKGLRSNTGSTSLGLFTDLPYKGMATILGRSSARNHMDRYEDIKNNLLVWGSDGSIKSILLINTSNRGKSTDHTIRFTASLAEDFRSHIFQK